MKMKSYASKGPNAWAYAAAPQRGGTPSVNGGKRPPALTRSHFSLDRIVSRLGKDAQKKRLEFSACRRQEGVKSHGKKDTQCTGAYEHPSYRKTNAEETKGREDFVGSHMGGSNSGGMSTKREIKGGKGGRMGTIILNVQPGDKDKTTKKPQRSKEKLRIQVELQKKE